MRTLAKIKRKAAKRQRGKEPLIVFATLLEAQATLDLLKATPLIRGELYAFDRGRILVSGIGALSSAIKIATYSHLADEIWNIGIAGAIAALPIGSIHAVQTISKFLPQADTHSVSFAHTIHPKFFTKSTGLNLLSVDVPLHNASLKNTLQPTYDLVDMEGYGIAFAASHCLKPLYIWKCISDFSIEKSEEAIQDNILECSIKMAHFLSARL